MDKVKKEYIWAAYAVLIVLLTVVGFFVGKSSGKSELYASVGAFFGALISIVLWVVWGEKNSY